jgi:hypothetical protein
MIAFEHLSLIATQDDTPQISKIPGAVPAALAGLRF